MVKKIFQIIFYILLYYSIVFSTFMVISGLYTAESPQDFSGTFLFVPVVLLVWMMFVQQLIKQIKGKKSVSSPPPTDILPI